MGRLNAKAKGDKYERELADYFNKWLYGKEQVYRAPLSGGGKTFTGGGSADLIGTDRIWVEAKRTEKLQPYAAIAQAEKGIAGHGSDELPVVINRRNNMLTEESLVFMRLKDWIQIYESYLIRKGFIKKDD
jgi:Holliday junction resolvase